MVSRGGSTPAPAAFAHYASKPLPEEVRPTSRFAAQVAVGRTSCDSFARNAATDSPRHRSRFRPRSERGSERGDVGLWPIAFQVHERAGHHDRRARLRDQRGVEQFHATIDLQLAGWIARVEHLARQTELAQRGLDERLTANTRIDRHHQEQVELLHQIGSERNWRTGIEGETRSRTEVADLSEGTMGMAIRLQMDRQPIRACLAES